MTISKEQIEHIAGLARLKLNDEEKEYYTSQLNQILGLIDKLNECDTANVIPTSHAVSLSNVFRDDIVRPSLSQDQVLRQSADKQNGMFRVPAVFMEKEGKN